MSATKTAMPAAPSITAKPTLGAIPEHSMVLLRHALPKEGLKAGAKGAVVHVYAEGEAYEVEFPAGRSRPCLVTLTADELEVSPIA